MENQYSALIIDLKGSRKYPDDERSAIQKYWNKITKILNVIFADAMKFEVDFCGGDQVQGLFYRPEAAYLYYRLFSICTHPIQTHGGIGVGSCNIQLDGKNTGGQDGVAYHRARAASDLADADIGYPILFNSGNIDRDRTINNLIGMAVLMALRHTTRQNQIMLLTGLLYPISDEDILFDCELMAGEINELILLKSEFDQNVENSKKKNLPLDDLKQLGEYPFTTSDKRKSGKRKNKTYFITEGKGRGIPQTLSDILGIYRQSIDTTLKTADIFTIRNLSIAALEEMRRI
ncbi:MAG: hypothetical protein IKT52_10540 [Oscillospiraceae bacterium]|nr:hypothetical protein [Oscillospiraceae bacterium]